MNDSIQNRYDAPKVMPENLEDNELLAEIVNIWNHGAKGSYHSWEDLFEFLSDNGHLTEINKVIREYNLRNGLPVGPWSTIVDFRPAGHAYYRDGAGRISIADNSGTTPDTCDDGPMFLDFSRDVVVEKATVPLKGPQQETGTNHATAAVKEEVEWVMATFKEHQRTLRIQQAK